MAVEIELPGSVTRVILAIALAVLVALPARAASDCSAEDLDADLECYQEAIREFLRGWVDAWGRGDAGAYLDHYVPHVSPDDALDRDTWEQQRVDRIDGREDIRLSLQLESMMLLNDGTTEVVFIQRYASQNYHDRVRKQLELRRVGKSFQILSEKTISVLEPD